MSKNKDIPLNIDPKLLKEIGMTEAEVIAIIDRIATRLSYRYTFGSYGRDDIKQEAIRKGLEGLHKYESDKPLENFLWVHMKNRMFNFKRDNYIRLDKPCHSCPMKAYIKPDGCKLFSNRTDCELFGAWQLRNETKKNIISPVSMSVVDDESGHNHDLMEAMDNKELLSYIDSKMPVYMRHIWLQAKAGVKVSAEEMRQLKELVLEIFANKGVEDVE